MFEQRLKKNCIVSCVLLLFLTAVLPATAQDSDPLLGQWRQKKDSVYINITQSNGVISAQMVRNDWSPGLIGKVVFNEIMPAKKNKYIGQAYLVGSDDDGVVNISLKGSNKMTTRVKPGSNKKISWIRIDPDKK